MWATKRGCCALLTRITTEEYFMDENRIAGTAKNVGGKVQESFGRVTGDAETEAMGIANQVSGTAQDLYGQARDNASEMAGAVRNGASSLETTLRNFIENQPYTAVAIAAGPRVALREDTPAAVALLSRIAGTCWRNSRYSGHSARAAKGRRCRGGQRQHGRPRTTCA